MKKIRIRTLRRKKRESEKIVMVTAHDAITAAYAEAAEVDVILVGDSLGMTALGFKTTINVTLEMMLHHAAAVARGASLPLLVGDLPFMSYKISEEQALRSAARMIQESGVEAVKIEGGAEMEPIIRRLVGAGLPVMGHIGLMPQSVHAQGGYRTQGRGEEAAERIINDAKTLDEAGVFALVLEMIPAEIAAEITRTVSTPTIGIGAGPDCDGQVLVQSDILGMTDRKPFKFARRYAELFDCSTQALKRYASDVREGKFPGPENLPGG